MGQETERKFLVRHDGWRDRATSSVVIRQAYLARSDALVVRVRSQSDGQAFLTIKSALKELSRAEFEYAVPADDAEHLIALADTAVLHKRRFTVPESGHTWTVDVFGLQHEGLVIAELELRSVDEEFVRPDWTGEEVTGDARFYNEALARALPQPVGG